MQRGIDPEAVQQNRGVAFGFVTAFFTHYAFEFSHPHAVLVSERVRILGVENLAFGQRLPQRSVAHDDRVEYAERIESKLILSQDAELARPDDDALGRLLVTRQDAHERGFASPIRTGKRIAASGQERGGDVLKEDFGAEAHGNVLYGNQGFNY